MDLKPGDKIWHIFNRKLGTFKSHITSRSGIRGYRVECRMAEPLEVMFRYQEWHPLNCIILKHLQPLEIALLDIPEDV